VASTRWVLGGSSRFLHEHQLTGRRHTRSIDRDDGPPGHESDEFEEFVMLAIVGHRFKRLVRQTENRQATQVGLQLGEVRGRGWRSVRQEHVCPGAYVFARQRLLAKAVVGVGTTHARRTRDAHPQAGLHYRGRNGATLWRSTGRCCRQRNRGESAGNEESPTNESDTHEYPASLDGGHAT